MRKTQFELRRDKTSYKEDIRDQEGYERETKLIYSFKWDKIEKTKRKEGISETPSPED